MYVGKGNNIRHPTAEQHMKTFLITTKAEKIEGTENSMAYRMAIKAKGKVEAKRIFKAMTNFVGKCFAKQIAWN